MPAPEDRSWTIAPTLAWFGGALVVALCIFDGGVQAIADRLTAKREDGPPAAGPAFAAPVVVAQRTDDDTPAVPLAPTTTDRRDRSKVGALEDICLEGAPPMCKRWAMDGFYAAIGKSKQGKLDRAVRVSWYGDSVIATDAIPGRLRTRLQTELGNGGPGFVYIVAPHRFCVHEGITRTTIGDWFAHSISTSANFDGLYGVGGSSADTHSGSATIRLTAGTATHLELYYLGQPNGGTAVVTADGTEIIRASTASEQKEPGYAAGTTIGAKKFELAIRGKARLFGMSIENTSGATVDNLGIVSVNVKNFGNNQPAHFAAELAHRNTDLVMVMIGANEAQWLKPGDRATKDYQSRYEKVLAPLRKARPNGSCLVVSPTDQAEAVGTEYPSRPVMPVLVAAQRKAAHASGCAFYSTYDWMGGKGSAARWYKKRLVGSDFQHLSRAGANKMADAIHDALSTGYQRYAAP
ncbi:MAG: GDSL-type esterase/lipase family protein [Kofleriaceae bacterium]